MKNSKFDSFREKYPKFIYDDYIIDEDEKNIYLKFKFEIENLGNFDHRLVIDKSMILKYNEDIDLTCDNFKNLVFNLGLVEMISYYKLTCAREIYVNCGWLSTEQKTWFKKLIYNGLGEFLYVNNIEVALDQLVNITSNNKRKLLVTENTNKLKGQLIPIGGGKDSCVSLEVLESMRKENTPFIINPRGATLNTVKVAGYEESYISVTRILDGKMINLNKEGFLNGHTPFSAMVAFFTTLIAYITNKKYIILSNESSANEPSVIGMDVNHQYSKSFEFENDFRNYEKKFLRTNTEYFSLLRPLNELQIAMLFSKYTNYHKIFRSCNKGSKDDVWCADCSKCLFVYIILSPFLDQKSLIDIFNKNMLDDSDMKEIFRKLIGDAESKPFDCVGTYEEINFAICKTISNMKTGLDELPELLKYYVYEHLSGDINKAEKISLIYEKDLIDGFEANNLNEKFEKLLRKALK